MVPSYNELVNSHLPLALRTYSVRDGDKFSDVVALSRLTVIGHERNRFARSGVIRPEPRTRVAKMTEVGATGVSVRIAILRAVFTTDEGNWELHSS